MSTVGRRIPGSTHNRSRRGDGGRTLRRNTYIAYLNHYSTLLARYETAKNRLDEITEEKQARAAKRESISRFISDLERCGGLLTEFDEALWYETVETATVHSESNVAVAFKDGSEVHVDVNG